MLINSNKNMTQKNYTKIRLVVVVITSIIFSQSLVLENFFIPVMTLAVASLTLLYLRKKVSGVIADERDYQLGGKAALLAIQVYSWIAVVGMFLLYSLQKINPYYEAIAMTLAFSTCILMLIYSLLYRYYDRIQLSDKRLIYTAVVLVIFFLMSIFTIRVFSGEDNWVCENGGWVKHGQPDFPAPVIECK